MIRKEGCGRNHRGAGTLLFERVCVWGGMLGGGGEEGQGSGDLGSVDLGSSEADITLLMGWVWLSHQ